LLLKTSDLADVVDSECKCRRSVRTIRLLGRTPEFVKTGGELCDVSRFTKIAHELNLSLTAWQAQLSRNSFGQDVLVICLDKSAKHMEGLVSERC